MKIKEISFDEILPYWQLLWANRKSPIEPMNGMLFRSGYDLQLASKYVPYFIAIVIENKIVGVNSFFQTDLESFRSRGLYVLPEYRNQMLGQILLNETVLMAKDKKAKSIWSFPRQSAVSTYQKVGFELVGSWIEEGVEFGPNIYAIKYL
jgi:GNAT superfamily N-acetyltransferase